MMRSRYSLKTILAATTALALLLTACGGADSDDADQGAEGENGDSADSDDGSGDASDDDDGGGGDDQSDEGPIAVGHLNYYSGPFADVGPFFECATDFAIERINEDPPLGRELEGIHDDIGTDGEAQVARRLLERDNVEVLLNPAHEYQSYRDFMLSYQEENDAPLMPSVHAGSIPSNIGGDPDEPLFRGAPMDTAQAVAAVLQAVDEGAENIAVVATEISGSQLQKEAALQVLDELGMEASIALDVQPEAANYRSEVSRIAESDPDAVLLFSQAEDGGTLVKQAAEAGESYLIIGTTEWLQSAFAEAATESAMEQHQEVWVAGFAHDEDSPAWDEYEPEWNSSDCAEIEDASNSYAIQYYDLLNVTALAIEAAGSTSASEWSEAVYEVAMEPGETVHTYQEGVEALRNGEEIDYNGVTGQFEYTDSGVVGGLYGIYEWTSTEDLELVTTIEGSEILEYDSQIDPDALEE